jgi:hypothetical protein
MRSPPSARRSRRRTRNPPRSSAPTWKRTARMVHPLNCAMASCPGHASALSWKCAAMAMKTDHGPFARERNPVPVLRSSWRTKPKLSRWRTRSRNGKTSSFGSPGPAGRTSAAFNMVHAPSAPGGAGKGPRNARTAVVTSATTTASGLGAFVAWRWRGAGSAQTLRSARGPVSPPAGLDDSRFTPVVPPVFPPHTRQREATCG